MSDVRRKKKIAILMLPAQELPVIEELVEFMQSRQLQTLQELLAYSVPELLKMEGFGYRCLKSLYNVLEENECEELLREK